MKFLLLAAIVIVGVSGRTPEGFQEATRKAEDARCQTQVLCDAIRDPLNELLLEFLHEKEYIHTPQDVQDSAEIYKTMYHPR